MLLLEGWRSASVRDPHRFAVGGGVTEPARVRVLVSRCRDCGASSCAEGLPGRVVTVPGGYRFDVPANTPTSTCIEGFVAEAGRTADRSLLREALRLWHGDGLASLGLQGQRSARRLVEGPLDALELWADLVIRQGVAEELPALADVCRRSPSRERLVAVVMLGMAQEGRQREALAFAHEARAVFAQRVRARAGRAVVQRRTRSARS